nr:zinc-binding dehydrogenase [Paenibacillus mangrovi]
MRPRGSAYAKFAWKKGAKRIIAIDHVDYRLKHAKEFNHVETYNFEAVDDLDQYLIELTKGGADVVIDCVGLDAKRTPVEKVETTLMLQGGSLGAFHMAANMVRKFGTISVVGVYGLTYNMFPFGHLFERNITLKMGLAPVIHYMPDLFKWVQSGEMDARDIITHRLPLSEVEHAYRIFDNKDDQCIKVVLKP